MTAACNLIDLRNKMMNSGIDVIVISMQNSFGNFVDGPSDVEFISDFSGSNGKAIISGDRAVLLVDGRYVKQAREQADNAIWEIKQFPDFDTTSIVAELWTSKNSNSSSEKVLGLISTSISYRSYLSTIEASRSFPNVSVKLIESNFLRNRQKSETKIFLHDPIHIGESSDDRINRIRADLEDGEVLLFTEQSMIGWLFGVRLSRATESKSIIPNCVAVVPKSGKPSLFCDLEIAGDSSQNFEIRRLDEFEISSTSRNIIVTCDYSTIPAYFISYLQAQGFNTRDSRGKYSDFFCVKNNTEIKNQRIAAELTSIAFIETLAFVENESGLTETDVSDFFENAAKKLLGFVDLSFNSISAFGENTSIVHYNPKICGNSRISGNGLFLFDAGIHFNNSTTDMTRTVFIGEIGDTDAEKTIKAIYTTVLKSVIMFSVAKFPARVRASSIDSIARYEVWRGGYDYQFGTGHGVGSFGNVHEPPRISQISTSLMIEGMVVTVEPGIYKQSFGIRLENMLLTKRAENDGFLNFETLNYIPFCMKLIDRSMLTEFEVSWLSFYNKSIRDKFTEHFKNDTVTSEWLRNNTIDLV
ncbi:MAG: M24 family metallopeptidase [Holosporales bacterium]|jgi:Xaa-Pro aminopeptidase|nr:M24 family metallopeptidase [Holosporales bacterium]